jgi:hypothetical protein
MPKPEMAIQPLTVPPVARPAALAELAKQLRDGPLQQLVELQAEIAELTERVSDCPSSRVEDLARLVRLSVSAMEHFNAFTREFSAVLREITDAHRDPH